MLAVGDEAADDARVRSVAPTTPGARDESWLIAL